MTTVVPLGYEDLQLMCRVLACWVRTHSESGDLLLDNYLRSFPVVQINQLIKAPPKAPERTLDLVDTFQSWLGGRPLEKTATPVVPRGSLMVELTPDGSKIVRCTIRIALFRLRPDTTLHADGWRFEIAEMSKDDDDTVEIMHPYQHCQAIVGWSTSPDCLIHPMHELGRACSGIEPSLDQAIDQERGHARDGIHVTHPALPLATTTLTGLAAAILTTLYGAPSVRTMLTSDAKIARSATGEIGIDLRRLSVIA